MGNIYVGDIGTDIILDTGVDISGQTTLQIKYTKPDKSTGVWSASVDSTTRAKYTTQSGDLDIAGNWKFQVYTVLAAWTGHSETVTIPIYPLFT